MDFHEAACIFPMLSEKQIDELAEDIKSNGQLVPIQLLDGKILDGRNRWMACLKIGKKPLTVEVEPNDPIAHVLSLNLKRRSLDEAQSAMVGGRAKALYEKQAKERQKASGGDRKSVRDNCPQPIEDKGRARDKAGEAVGVSGKQVDRAVKVLSSGSKELIAACDSGEVAVSAAAKIAALPKTIQNDIIKQARDEGKDVGKAVAQAAKHVVPQADSDWTDSEKTRRQLVESGKTVVANKRSDQRLIRWAMENGKFMPIDRGTQWGNPFVVDSNDEDNDGDRDTVCESFNVYFDLKPSLQKKVPSLHGKVLGCWCYPERCHGNRLCEEANS
jgi:Domain of unknown function (DUF4326)/ParB-like nuclease domain